MKKILLLATGGTIASAPCDDGLVPVLTAGDILRFVPGLDSLCEIDCRTILNLDSSNIQPEEWQLIVREVYSGLSGYDGIVITHGTDTMAYTASMLSFMLIDLNKPVVLTGSQLPILEKNTDAVENLLSAFQTAVLDIHGVFIVFGKRVIKGVRAVKVRTTSLNAFESINADYAGYVEDGVVRIADTGAAKPAGSVGLDAGAAKPAGPVRLDDRIDPSVFLLKLIPGTRPEFFDNFASMGYKGLVLEAFGLGGIHFLRRNIIERLGRLLDAGIAVVVTSQCLYEMSDLTVYEVGRKAAMQGIIPGYDMTSEAAVTKLMWVLGHTAVPGEVKRMMLTDYCGEINARPLTESLPEIMPSL